MPWSFKFYDKGVESDMTALDASQKASLLHIRDLLNEFGVTGLGMPLSKPLGDGLFEFRLQGVETIARVFYCFHGKEVVFYLLAFVKKTQKAPKNLVETAKKRMKEVKNARR
jgi:phage-related protein